MTSDASNDPSHLPVREHHAEMDSTVAGAPPRRPVPLVTVLGVVLLLFATGMGAWVVWQLSAGGRAPAAFRERSPLPQCASITVPQAQPIPTALTECLLSAGAQREGAEVLVTSLTTEGDPIETYYRVRPGEGVEVFTDATADSFGSGEWSHDRCPDVAALESGQGCQPE
ncbi:hypothetical protein Krad_2841 [Kineococcus radiotolerans SRS30216 = ATCC BAA-149]|uniref:Uncharacterized protein n=2 Tax=Kineococcus radiotolerans TaxID=131568 RepID=A6WBX0_KINRD|nr:hypothetical protein Krad_2841 [Kineococcus radiotolerans SRS30216 = ATCC BAA-149]